MGGKQHRVTPLCRGAMSRTLCAVFALAGIGSAAPIAIAQPPQFGGRRQPEVDAAPQTQRTAGGGRLDVLQPAFGNSLRTAQRPATVPPGGEFAPPLRPEEIEPRVRAPETGAGGQLLGAVTDQPFRLPLLPGVSPEFVDPPPRPEVQREYGRFVQRTIDPEVTLDLIVGRPRILVFNQTPTRIYIPQETIATYDIISDTEIAVRGVAEGRTVLTIWTADPDRPGGERVLSYLLRVSQDAGYKVRLEAVYAALEKEINRDFPNSFVKLSLIGDQLVIRGQAKDVVEATQIIRIVSEHAPPSRDQDRSQPTNLTVSQTAYSPEGVLQASEDLGFTLDRLATFAGLEGEANVVNLLQIPGEQQVMLRITVAEVNRTALRSIGVNLDINGGSGVGFLSAFPSGNVVQGLNTGILALEGGTLSVTRGDLGLTLNALKQQGLSRTLAEPNLVTLHGRPARFQAGGEFPIPVARVGFGSAAQGVEYIPFGVQVRFVPYIVDRDKIRLTVAANISTRSEGTTDVGGSQVPSNINTRNFSNTVELREGQTLGVAGLIQTNFGGNTSRVPILGDLPFVGRLFKSDDTSAGEQELVILITPELVHPLDPEECLSLPGSDVFEPSDVEFYLKGYLESRRSQDYRSPVRTDWARQQRYRRCEDQFIIGPSGHTYGCRSQAPPISGNVRAATPGFSSPTVEQLPPGDASRGGQP